LVDGISESIHNIILYYTCELKFHLLSEEIILVDKKYIQENIMIYPFKPAKIEGKKINSTISNIYQIMEHIYG
jgi:hypothetical protein